MQQDKMDSASKQMIDQKWRCSEQNGKVQAPKSLDVANPGEN